MTDSANLLNARREEIKERLFFLYKEGRELGMTKADFIDCLQTMEV